MATPTITEKRNVRMRDALQMILLAAISGDATKQQIAKMAHDALAAEQVSA